MSISLVYSKISFPAASRATESFTSKDRPVEETWTWNKPSSKFSFLHASFFSLGSPNARSLIPSSLSCNPEEVEAGPIKTSPSICNFSGNFLRLNSWSHHGVRAAKNRPGFGPPTKVEVAIKKVALPAMIDIAEDDQIDDTKLEGWVWDQIYCG